MWGIVESYSNLTPRGLVSPITGSQNIKELNKQILTSFLLPKRESNKSEKFEYMVFVWNGKNAHSSLRSTALCQSFELEKLINKGSDPFLQILFSGGVFRNKKLQKGTIIQLNTSMRKPNANIKMDQQFNSMRETVYLFKFIFPSQMQEDDSSRNKVKKVQKPMHFNNLFLKKEVCSEEDYFAQNFVSFGEDDEDDVDSEEEPISNSPRYDQDYPNDMSGEPNYDYEDDPEYQQYLEE